MKIIINKRFALLKGNVPTMPAGRQEGKRVLPAFTLIEILVVVGVLTVLVVSVGGIMGMTFKAKNSSEGNELLSSKAAYVLTELKRNVLNADVNQISCPADETRIHLFDKDNVSTILSCDSTQIASISGQNGTFYLLDNGILPSGCDDFVTCNFENDKVKSVEFVLRLRAPANAAGAGSTGVYYGVATPRE